MGVLDPRLKFLQRQSVAELATLESLTRFSVAAADSLDAGPAPPAPSTRVLLGFAGDVEEVRRAGFRPTTVVGRVAAGSCDIDKLDQVARVPGVRLLESSRPMSHELNISRVDTFVDQVQAPPTSLSGAGVIVGLIDSGIDYLHPCFRNPDGSTRILAIWDQFGVPRAGEVSPAGFDYGVEYTRPQIDAALSSANPLQVVRHFDGSAQGHGTHVAGIAAGNGSAPGNGAPAGTFVGMAPRADLVIVANNSEANLGDSANTLDAVSYIFSAAQREGKPAVINLSQGDNLGPHDGTSLLERGIDQLLSGPGRCMVKSAGNSGADDIHASGWVPRNGQATIAMQVPANDTTPDTIDLWYAGIDRFDVRVATPGGQISAAVAPGQSQMIDLANGNQVFIDSSTANPFNSDNRIYLQILPGVAGTVQPGVWTLALGGLRSVNGVFHAWIERDTVRPRFVGGSGNPAFSVTVPGTSRKIVTVGSYVTRPTGRPGEVAGALAETSSLGPTRDFRLKPEVSAPGQWIASALAGGSGQNQYRLLAGTSMAAPHVAGLIALMLERRPDLTQEQARDILMRSARRDQFVGETPNVLHGFGKINAVEAIRLLG